MLVRKYIDMTKGMSAYNFLLWFVWLLKKCRGTKGMTYNIEFQNTIKLILLCLTNGNI